MLTVKKFRAGSAKSVQYRGTGGIEFHFPTEAVLA